MARSVYYCTDSSVVGGRTSGQSADGAADRDRKAPLPRELFAAASVLFAVGVSAYGWYVLNGGLYGDDWGNFAEYRFSHAPRYLTAVHSQVVNLGGRPILAALLPVPSALFGLHPSLHIAFGVLLVVVTSLCFYVLLRVLDFERLDAAAMAALALIFPWADAIELWPTASVNTVAVIFFLVGLLVALRGLNRPGRAGVAMHAAAALLYLMSVLTYEVAGAAAMLAGLLYLRRATPRRALLRWGVDVVVVTAGLTYSLIRTSPVRHVGTLEQRIADVPQMARQSLALFASALVPLGKADHVLRPIVVVVVVAFVVVVVARVWRGKDESRWLFVGLGSTVAIAAAYFMFLGSGLLPLDPATGTRTNVFARFGYAALVYAVVAAATQLVVRTRQAAKLTTLAVVALIAVGYSIRLAHDESAWARASRLQGNVLDAINDEFRHLQPGTTLATFDFPAEVAPGAPVFVATWDLTGAVRVERHDPTLNAFPIYATVTVRCQANQIVIHLPGSRGTATADYSKLFFLDVATGRTARVTSASSCTRALTRFAPGAYFAT
jgi:hypothetical protein